jgi:general secretion pathway protein J
LRNCSRTRRGQAHERVPLPLGEGGAAKREPDRAKHEEKAPGEGWPSSGPSGHLLPEGEGLAHSLHPVLDSSAAAAGFTLIEVVVSITIMAMLSVIILSALRSATLAWDKDTNRIEQLRRSRIATDILNDQIRGALPLTYTVRTTERVNSPLAFDGTRSGIRFVSRASFKDGPDGIPRWVDLKWADGSLNVEERRILSPDNLPDPNTYWRDSVFQGQSCTFDFLAQTASDQPAKWTDEWHYPAQPWLPRAVRLRCVSEGRTLRSVIPLDYALSSTMGLTLR